MNNKQVSHGYYYLDSRVGGKGDDPDEIHEGGGVAGKIEYRCDLLDPVAILTIAGIMHEGVTKGRETDNWRKLPANTHINHALTHLMLHMSGSKTEDHLGRALTRLMMAVGVESTSSNNQTERAIPRFDTAEPLHFVAPVKIDYLAYPYSKDPDGCSKEAIRIGKSLMNHYQERNEGRVVLVPHAASVPWEEKNYPNRRKVSLDTLMTIMLKSANRVIMVENGAGILQTSQGVMEEVKSAVHANIEVVIGMEKGYGDWEFRQFIP